MPYATKACSNYKDLLGGIVVEGTTLSKKIGRPGRPCDIENLKNSENYLDEINKNLDFLKT